MLGNKRRKYFRDRYRNKMDYFISLLGGICVKCGSSDRLEIDHIDRSIKTLDIARKWGMPEDIILQELKKCQVLCRLCHEDKTTIERGLTPSKGTHGTLSAYRNCKCEICKLAKQLYSRKAYLKQKGRL